MTPKRGAINLSWFFILERRTDFLMEKSKMSELSRTKFLGLSVEAALDLRFGGIDARI